MKLLVIAALGVLAFECAANAVELVPATVIDRERMNATDGGGGGGGGEDGGGGGGESCDSNGNGADDPGDVCGGGGGSDGGGGGGEGGGEGPGDGGFGDGETGVVSAVPEPASWAMLIVGFGLTGAAMRRRQRASA